MGSRPAVTGRTGATKNGASGNGVQAPKNGAVRIRPAANAHAPPAPEPAIKLVGIAKSFGKHAVLKDVNLAIAPGELFEVTGPSGAGKTTLLRLIHGQLRPNAGEVWVRGRGLHRWWRLGLNTVRRDVAFVFQEQRLLPRLNAFENIVLALQVGDPQVPNRTIKQRAFAALESVHLAHRRRAYPHQLSAGERQRIAIARALATKPRVLLADEPLASMDDDNAAMVTQLLEAAVANGTTVIVATHHHTFPASRILRLPSAKVMTNGARKPRLIGNGNGHADGHNGGSNGNGNGNGNGNSALSAARTPLWRALIPARERPHRAVKVPRLPWWRREIAFFANSYRLVVLNGLRSWSRDARLTAPVIGTIALLLVLCGTLALIGIAAERAIADQAGQASLVRVYLAPDATTDSVAALKSKLLADPRVASVTYITPEQALAEASNRPGLDNLSSLSSTNPFPASLDVRVKKVTQVAAVASLVHGDAAVDPTYPTSYDPDTYSRLRHFALVAGGIAGGLLLLFAFVAYAVVANSMRGIAVSRKQEVAVVRLLGARSWMLRGPFVVEGLMTGALAGALAAAAVAGVYVLAVRFESAIYTQVLPGVNATSVQYVLAAVITAGLILGTATAMLGFRKARA
ncbi:MAG TPA: permease-like cell division protein FtsX [Candidatus Sulfotelmatobacter sp.]|nr:permease-like cell division protein FtsX [Candidatus Sulfotelmatobacter sp.]